MTTTRSRPPTRENAEDTKDLLIHAATRLFAAKGFDGSSIKEIADAAGVNVSLVSYHFGGKDGLYRTTLEKFGRARLEFAERVLQPAQTVEEFSFRLKMFIEEMLKTHIDEPEITQILHRECDLGLHHAQDVFKETFMKTFETLTSFFKAAQDSGLLSPEVNPTVVARLFFGSIVHAARTDKISEKFFGQTIRDPKYRAHLVEQAVRYCVSGCLKHERGAF